MLIYIITFLFIIVLGLFSFSTEYFKKDPKAVRKLYIQLVCFVFILVSGLRNLGVGEDTYGYYIGYNDIAKTSWRTLINEFVFFLKTGEGKDLGFSLFVKATQIISREFQFFLLLIATLFYIVFGNFIYKNTRSLTSAIIAFTVFYVLFFYVFSITAIRQSITIAAALYCYELIKKRKLIPFLIIILLFSTIHKSLLVFIPFYFISIIKKPHYLFYVVLIIFPVILMFKDFLAEPFLTVAGYGNYEQYEAAGAYVFTAIFLFVALIAILRMKIIIRQNKRIISYINALTLALLFLPLAWIHPALLRVTMYFSIFIILLIPEIIQSFNHYSVHFRRSLIVISVMALFFLFVKNNYSRENADYRFFWEEVKLGKNYE